MQSCILWKFSCPSFLIDCNISAEMNVCRHRYSYDWKACRTINTMRKIYAADVIFQIYVVQFRDPLPKYNWTNISLNLVYEFRNGSFSVMCKKEIKMESSKSACNSTLWNEYIGKSINVSSQFIIKLSIISILVNAYHPLHIEIEPT